MSYTPWELESKGKRAPPSLASLISRCHTCRFDGGFDNQFVVKSNRPSGLFRRDSTMVKSFLGSGIVGAARGPIRVLLWPPRDDGAAQPIDGSGSRRRRGRAYAPGGVGVGLPGDERCRAAVGDLKGAEGFAAVGRDDGEAPG